MLQAVIQGFLPVSLRLLLNRLLGNESVVKVILTCVCGYGLVYLLYNTINVIWYMLLDKLGGNIIQYVREKSYSAIKYADYENIMSIGKDKIKNILFMDTLNLFSTIALQSVQLVADLLILMVFLVLAAYVNWSLGIILLLGSVVGFVIAHRARKVIIKTSRTVNAKMKEDNEVLNQYVDAIELEKTIDLGNYFSERNRKSLWRFINTSIEVDKKQIFLKNVIEHFHQLFSICVTVYLMLISNNNFAGDVVFFLLVSDIVLGKSQEIENIIYSIYKAIPSCENVEQIMTLDKSYGEREVKNIRSIEFKNVSFYYNTNHINVLEDINCKFYAGDIIKVCGTNGSGKSTFLKLLVGLLKAKSGEVLFDGVSVGEITKECLNQQILYVGQEEVLLNETFNQYLSIVSGGKYNPQSMSSLLEYLKINAEKELIQENGKNLSNGQRKKLLILKLLASYKDVSIIILDEIDGGLDIETKEVLEKLEREIINNNVKSIIFKISHKEDENLEKYTHILDINKRITIENCEK